MPKIIINGQMPGGSRGPGRPAPGTSAPSAGGDIGSLLAQAVGGDQQALQQLTLAGPNAAFSPSFQRSGTNAAQAALLNDMRNSVRAGNARDSAARIAAGAALIGQFGSMGGEAGAALGAFMRRAGRGSAGSVVAYRPTPITAYTSSSTDFNMQGGSYSPSGGSGPGITRGGAYFGGLVPILNRIDQDIRTGAMMQVSAIRGGGSSAVGFSGQTINAAPGSYTWSGGGRTGGGGGPGPILPPGGGGGGGGYGGGGGGGGIGAAAGGGSGGHGFMRGAAAGILGSFPIGGRLLRGAALGGGPGLIAEAAVEAAKDIAFAPQKIAGMVGSAIGNAEPYMDIRRRAYRIAGDVGGDNAMGDAIQNSVFPGGYRTPNWMLATGTKASEALGMLESSGIRPSSASEGEDVMNTLASGRYMTGLRGFSDDQRSEMVRQARIMGVPQVGGAAAGAGETLLKYGEVMQNAISRGFDQATVAKSIQSLIGQSVRSGSISPSDISNSAAFASRFYDMPGGQTGERASSAMAGAQGAIDSIGTNPYRSMIALSAATKMHSMKDITDLMGPGVLSTPEGKLAAENLLKANAQGNGFASMQYFQAMINGNPQAWEKAVSQSGTTGVLGSVMEPILRNAAGGEGLMNTIAGQIHPGGTMQPGSVGSQDMSMMNLNAPNGDVSGALLRMGVRPDLVPMIIRSTKDTGINPLVVGAQMMAESSGGKDRSTSAWNMPANVNVMQITSGQTVLDSRTGRSIPVRGSGPGGQPASAEESIQMGVLMDIDKARGGGGLDGMLQRYRGPSDPAYMAKIHSYLGGVSTAVPTDVNTVDAQGDTVRMQGAYASFSELSTILPAVNSGLRAFSDALHVAIDLLHGAPGSRLRERGVWQPIRPSTLPPDMQPTDFTRGLN